MSTFNQLLPLWAVILSVLAFFASETFVLFEPAILPLLGGIMFMMGLTLTAADFRRIAQNPLPVIVGVAVQFTIMPILALTLATMLQLSTQLTAGLVLVGSCAGGTASNVIAFLARGDMALSISMTMASTLLGVLATPFLCAFYLSEAVTVDVAGMLLNLIAVVLIPVAMGLLCNRLMARQVRLIKPALPSLAILAILIIIATVVALNADQLLQVGPVTLAAVMLHNILGLAAGFYLSRLFGFDLRQSQTIAIEVGMQNSGLGVALALQFFSATAALPGALFSVWHNISGSMLAAHWSKKRESLDYLLRDSDHLKTE